MNVKYLTLATAGALLLGGAAQADIVGLHFEQVADGSSIDTNGDFIADATVDVYRLYADSDDPNDVVTSQNGQGLTNDLNYRWSSDLVSPFDNGGSGFVNHAFGGDRPVESPLVNTFPDLLLDTYMTIGLESNAGPLATDVTSFAPGTTLGALTGTFVMSDGNNGGTDNADGLGALFMTPDQAQGTPDGSGRVLLAQIAVSDGEHVSVAMNIGWNSFLGRGGPGSGRFEASTIVSTPTPGALALLGLAGVAGTRRRRK